MVSFTGACGRSIDLALVLRYNLYETATGPHAISRAATGPQGVANDTYDWRLFDPGGDSAWRTPDLGYVGEYTLTDLPEGAAYGTVYRWWVRPYQGPDSYGSSFYDYAITFSSGGARRPRASIVSLPVAAGRDRGEGDRPIRSEE